MRLNVRRWAPVHPKKIYTQCNASIAVLHWMYSQLWCFGWILLWHALANTKAKGPVLRRSLRQIGLGSHWEFPLQNRSFDLLSQNRRKNEVLRIFAVSDGHAPGKRGNLPILPDERIHSIARRNTVYRATEYGLSRDGMRSVARCMVFHRAMECVLSGGRH